jgi:hypothetical protein
MESESQADRKPLVLYVSPTRVTSVSIVTVKSCGGTVLLNLARIGLASHCVGDDPNFCLIIRLKI